MESKVRYRLLLIILVSVPLGMTGWVGSGSDKACQPVAQEDPSEVENLAAFARIYGYVRFFHPSDPAKEIDWAGFAVLGSERVAEAGSRRELLATLRGLFLPIAPTVQIFPSDETPPDPVESSSAGQPGESVVAWQHQGYSLEGSTGPYRSIRVGRENRFLPPGGAVLTQSLNVSNLRGREVRLTASVKADVDASGGNGGLWLRVDREGGAQGFLDAMADRPITRASWQEYEIFGEIAEDAVRVTLGALLRGEGTLWVDDFVLATREAAGSWARMEVQNPGFEGNAAGEAPSGWVSTGQGAEVLVTDGDAVRGTRSLSLTRAPEIFTGTLFDAVPSLGEVIEEEVGAGISIRVPLALPGTVAEERESDESTLSDLRTALAGVEIHRLTADEERVRIAATVVGWNVFQHFYPYFDEVGVDWAAELPATLERALADEDGESFFRTLKLLVARLRDGHGRVIHPQYQQNHALPLVLEWVEGQAVVTASGDARLRPGDVVRAIDGVPAESALEEEEALISGSPQWMRHRALREVLLGSIGTSAQLTVARGSEEMTVRVERRPFEAIEEARPEDIDLLEDGIYYVNLDRASAQQIGARIEELASARGVVFDLRGYPNGNHQVIGHLLQEPDTSTSWMRVQRIIYPDQKRISGHQHHGWNIQPLEPHISGKVVFLTDRRAISYAESFMSFIEHYRLGEIVGQPTAGANGNVNPFSVPGGFRITWTGMKVVKHDGSQHHLVGVQPTVPMVRSIQGIREGRDELLERALEIIKAG